ncbi:unnamed protein product, partial [Choristocarpus tenellus]
QVKKEWVHFNSRNQFALPLINFMLMSRLCMEWAGNSHSSDLAKVLYWIGSAPLVIVSILVVARWVALPNHDDLMNPLWMLMPVGNMIGAMVARSVDEDYYEWGWFVLSVGAIMYLALWPATFLKSVSTYHADTPMRSTYGIWIAPTAVMMLAYVSLEEVQWFNNIQRLLFYSALFLALVLAACVWPLNFFVEGKFNMNNWVFAFPLDALAAASVTAYTHTKYDTMQVIYIIVLSAACLANAVFTMSTVGLLKARHLFVPHAKLSPLSFMKISHEAIRAAVTELLKLSVVMKPGIGGAASIAKVVESWNQVNLSYGVLVNQKEKALFPAVEEFFPGQMSVPSSKHAAHMQHAADIQSMVNAISIGKDKGFQSDNIALSDLESQIMSFGKGLLETLKNEEFTYSAPIARKFFSVQLAKDVTRKCWEYTAYDDMASFVGWVLNTLRIRGQRSKFLKTWVWSMPERGHQLGLMVYRAVDDVTWVEVARDVPEIVPRGLPGYSRYY